MECLSWVSFEPSWNQFSSVQLLSHIQLLVIPWTAACKACLFITNSQSLLKLMSIRSVMPSNNLILCHPLLLPPSIFPSIRVFPMTRFFTSGGQSIGGSASASVLPMNVSGWFPLGLTGFDLFAVQGTLKSLLQHHSSKTSILHHSAFFIVQLSHPYMTTGKTTALTWWTSVSKVMLCFLICCLGLSQLFFQGASIF